MAETLTKSIPMSYVGFEKIFSKGGGGGRPPVAGTDSELPTESPIFDFAYRLPENPDSFYLNVVGIPPSPARTITKKIYFCNYDENYD